MHRNALARYSRPHAPRRECARAPAGIERKRGREIQRDRERERGGGMIEEKDEYAKRSM